MKPVLFFFFSMLCSSVSAWQLEQVKINHVQLDQNGKTFYLTVGESAETVSGCRQVWNKKNWAGFRLEENNEAQKILISMALAAYMSGTLVDVGGEDGKCVEGLPLPKLNYIRVGNYR